MVPVFDYYFYPEFAAKGAIKQPSVENVKFTKLHDVQQTIEKELLSDQYEETKSDF